MISIRYAREVDVDYADVVRHSSVADLPNALETMIKFIDVSTWTFVGCADGKVGCVYGLITPTLMSDRAHMWLLTTDLVNEHKFAFIRHSQVVIEGILQRYNQIVGETSVKDEKALKWMRWLGAEFKPPPSGIMLPFQITKESFGRRHGSC